MQKDSAENSRIILNLLESVSRDGERSQRLRASEFGVALGLVNSYLKYCVRKGYIKVKRIPAQRYIYFLTPKGFAEKSRLTVLLLSNSLAFFRQARADCAQVLKTAEARSWKRVVLAGASELAEISTLCALETGITIVAVLDAEFGAHRFIDLPVVRSFTEAATFDGVIVTDRLAPQEQFNAAIAACGTERVLAPSLLGISAPEPRVTT
jgi:DNA-binding MarR family transcriptional regulator